MALASRAIGYRPVVVSSGSMAPTMRTGDIAVTDPRGAIAVGTVIDFATGRGSRIHRVVGIEPNGYRTKGDANQSADSGIVATSQVRGTGVLLVPFVGLPRQWLAKGQWLQLALTAFLLSCSVFVARRGWRLPSRARRKRTT